MTKCAWKKCTALASFTIKRYRANEADEKWEGICYEHLEAELEATIAPADRSKHRIEGSIRGDGL